VCDIIWQYHPKSVLDIGPGFGRWGFLAREMLDVFQGRIAKSTWKTRICCVEAYSGYVREQYSFIYDRVFVDCGRRFLSRTDERFDMIIAGDVLEHFEKSDALDFIRLAREKSNKAVVLCVPIGTGYPQGQVQGNPMEAHLSTWETAEFEKLGALSPVFTCRERIKSRPYAVAIFEK
jgi:hypothetical protein